jgi:glucoamylase
MIQLANGGGVHPARRIVGGDFLQLVRFGIRAPDDPTVLASIEVIDRVLKRQLPQGPCWRRYNHDGYGQKADGSAFDGQGVGRSWPILTGERGHYELAAGRDPMPFIRAMEKFANVGHMISEQLWDDDDLPGTRMKRGMPTGAAMPLCWSHAEYVSLVRSCHDGVCFDRIQPAYDRYVARRAPNTHEMWTLHHPLRRVPRGKTLRIILADEATIVWTPDGWRTKNSSEMTLNPSLKLWFADLATGNMAAGALIEFTLFWKSSGRWEGRDWKITILQ